MVACCALTPKIALAAEEALEGTVEHVRPAGLGGVDLELVSGTNQAWVRVENAGNNAPALYSRVRVEKQTVTGWKEVQQLTGNMEPLAQSTADLRRMGAAGQHAGCVANLSGQVLGVSPSGKTLALADSTGVALLHVQPSQTVAAGEIIHLQGNCVVEGAQAFFQSPALVDNNGIHWMTEKSGSNYLTAGRHALRLDWFNREYPYGLQVYYAGPGLERQPIPESALFRREINPETGQEIWTNGVSYRCFEGDWLRMPDFSSLQWAKEGTVSNFAVGVATRTENVGLEFKGFVEAPREGLYTFSTISDDGSLMFIDEQPQSIEIRGKSALPAAVPILPRQILSGDREIGWAEVEGTVTFASERSGQMELELSSDTGRMEVEVTDDTAISPRVMLNRRIRATGVCLSGRITEGKRVAATLLSPGANQIEFWDAASGTWSRTAVTLGGDTISVSKESSTNLPVLTEVEQVKQLTREQWQRGYPVKLRGVVTTVLDSGMFIEDSSWSIYARWKSPTESDVPRVGDYWEIEGETFAEFAPNILVRRAVRLGTGALPEPLHPTWDQLINGSLDTEYVEIQGVITSVSSEGVTLRTRAGTLGVELIDLQPQAVESFTNALVRVRGCVIPVRDIHTQQVEPGRIRLSNASLTVDELPPSDPFSVPTKRASDLLLFDWRAGAFQRVKIAGQILCEQHGEYFLADGNEGLRFIPKAPVDLKPGDLAEVAGFLELAGPSPVLRDAVARRTGAARMPQPKALASNSLLNRRYDATLVTVRARLTQINHDRLEDVLELQSEKHSFLARLKRRDGPLPTLAPGSLLELTGVYAGQGGDLSSGGEITAFELLLNSSDDVKLLARPSWWTIRRALMVVGGMMLVLAVGLVWIALLRRQVEERSQQLTAEIRRHEHTERQRELEAERARIAQDLHDDLGAALTQIRFLSAVESRDLRTPESTRSRMEQVSEKSREMVASLDEIVWAINPANDSSTSLADYFCHFAEEFFRVTSIRCRLDVADVLPSATLTSEVRHHLYLAMREALNNIAKHSGATEVWLRIQAVGLELRIALEDNGRGFAPQAAEALGRGVNNMRTRLQKIGGRFECESHPGSGTICRFVAPLGAALQR